MHDRSKVQATSLPGTQGIKGRTAMKVDVTTDIVIDLSVAAVAEFSADPTNAPAWYANIRSIEWRTAPTVAVGSVVAFVARFLGRTLRYDYEIVEYTPGERLVMSTAQGPFPMQTTYLWKSVEPDRTRMTLRNTGEPDGFSRLVAPLMVPAMQRANRRDLARLKALLEAR